MKFMKLQLAGMVLLSMFQTTPKPKSIVHVTHLGRTDAAITCDNAKVPTVKTWGDVLIVGCGAPSELTKD